MQAVDFPVGIPQLIILESPEGIGIGNGFLFRLTDGRYLHLERGAADSLRLIGPRAGEPFYICKRPDAKSGWYWDMWLTPQGEQYRAAEEIQSQTGEDLTPLLLRSVEQVRRRGKPAEAPAAAPPPPAEQQQLAPAPAQEIIRKRPAAATVPVRIPFNVAFYEVTRFVAESLKTLGEQWGDQARQDAVSTILIAAAKAGHITIWEREESRVAA